MMTRVRTISFAPFSLFAAVSLGVFFAGTFQSFSVSDPFPSMFQAFRSLLTVSFHCNFGLPQVPFPSIFISATARMFSVSPLLLTCPNHSSLFRLITIATASTFAYSKISSFLRCSNRSPPLPIAPFSSLLLPYAFHL